MILGRIFVHKVISKRTMMAKDHVGNQGITEIFTAKSVPETGSAGILRTKPSRPTSSSSCTDNMADNNRKSFTSLKNVIKIAKELAFDVVGYVSGIESTLLKASNTTHSKTMRRTVDEILQKHEILFKGMVKKLQVSENTIHATIDNIANEMMADRHFNWGRLVTLYAFSGLLAKHCCTDNDNETHRKLAEKVAVYTGNYVEEHLADFICENGGWEAFDDFFPEPQYVEKAVWKGLLYTVVGLGAIATMVATR